MANKYNYNTFKELFDTHIQYAYEPQYGCYIDHESRSHRSLYGEDSEVAVFHKLTIYSTGFLDYKGHEETYDPRLWPKVVQLVELLTETPAEKVLYGQK